MTTTQFTPTSDELHWLATRLMGWENEKEGYACSEAGYYFYKQEFFVYGDCWQALLDRHAAEKASLEKCLFQMQEANKELVAQVDLLVGAMKGILEIADRKKGIPTHHLAEIWIKANNALFSTPASAKARAERVQRMESYRNALVQVNLWFTHCEKEGHFVPPMTAESVREALKEGVL